jgi:tRNA pseudouridine38-40 synthase
VRTIRLTIEYDGTAFAGWQIQEDDRRTPTVQGEIESALSRMTQESIRVRAASRTDSGVHARGQVVAFDTTKDNLPIRAFTRGMGALLSPALVVRHAEIAPDGWDPRRTSRGKRYRYTYWNDETNTAIDRHRAWWVRGAMDVVHMQKAATHLVGTHDFEAFRSAGCDAKHAVRTLYEVKIARGEYARIHLEVVGNAFVRNMVRIIAGNLRDVGLARMTPDDLRALLESRDRTKGAMTAPAHGLCLEEVIYDDRLPERPDLGSRSGKAVPPVDPSRSDPDLGSRSGKAVPPVDPSRSDPS